MTKILLVLALCVFALPLKGHAQERKRDVFMRASYVALAGMVVADGSISQDVITRGGHESGWPYKHVAHSPLKFGLTLGAMNGAAGLGAYGLHKRNRVAGRVVMAGLLVAKAFVIKHNYDVAKRQRLVR